MTNDKISLNDHSDFDLSNQINDFIYKAVRTEKVHYGKVIIFRTICPNCDETLFRNDLDFICDTCSIDFKGIIDSLRIEVTSPSRKTPSSRSTNPPEGSSGPAGLSISEPRGTSRHPATCAHPR